jgi:Lamin Tail Domain
MLPERASLFAGRPPLLVRLRVTGASEDLYLVVLHLKAQATETDRLMRRDEAAAIKDYLDAQLPSQRVLVLGDWNDDLDASTVAGAQTPFQNFLDDPTRYGFLTWTLTQANKRTTAGFPTVIDHQLATNELVSAPSCDPLTVPVSDRPDYKNVTTDHLPVLTAFDLRGAEPVAGAKLLAPNGGELLSEASYELRWAPGGSNALHLEYALEGSSTWSHITSDVASSAGRYGWSLPAGAEGRARVRLVDAASGAVLDASSCPVTLGAGAAVSINELLADPTGYTSGATDFGNQYVELYNRSASVQDLSGLWVNEEEAYAGFAPTRHVFAPGTQLAAGKAQLLWSRNVNGGDGLRLDRSAGDAVYLQDANGCVVDRVAYPRAPAGPLSLNRSPDLSGTGPLVDHSSLGTGFQNSPGQRANRAAF